MLELGGLSAIVCLIVAVISYPLAALYVCYLIVGLLLSLFTFCRKGFQANEIILTVMLSLPPLCLFLTLIERRNTFCTVFNYVAVVGGLLSCFLLLCFNHKFSEKSLWLRNAKNFFILGYLIFAVPVATYTIVP